MDYRGWTARSPAGLRPLGLLIFSLATLSLALWSLGLGQRPLHNDEAVNGIKFGRLWQGGGYQYDPNEHHGPSLYYATYAINRLTGAPAGLDTFSEARLRLVTVVFGVGLILLLPLLVDGLGRRGIGWAALLTAVSPAVVFYSRYFIHEVLLVFFTFLSLAAGWRYWRSRKLVWALLAGLGLGLMDATKETFVIAVVVAGLALGANFAWNRWLQAAVQPTNRPRLRVAHLLAFLAVWLGASFLLFSSFFSNAAGPIDSIRTYLPWMQRAEGASPHIHPWHFYWHRLLWFHVGKGPVWSEAFVLLLALLGARAAFVRQGLADANVGFVRLLALYSFGLAAAYCLIAYKTTWCLLGFWHGMILLAGVGAAWLTGLAARSLSRRWLQALLLIGAGHLAWQAWLLNTTYAADRRNPYIYAQTSPDLLTLVDKVQDVIRASPQGTATVVKVISPESDYWPLPWYFRNLTQVGWYDALPADPFAPIMVVSANLRAALEEKQTHVMVGYFQLRPQVFLELYVELKLWQSYLTRKGAIPAPATAPTKTTD